MTNTPIEWKSILYMKAWVYFECMRDIDTLSWELKKAKDSEEQEKLLKCPCILTLRTAQGNTRTIMDYFIDTTLIMAIIDTQSNLNNDFYPQENAEEVKQEIVKELKK